MLKMMCDQKNSWVLLVWVSGFFKDLEVQRKVSQVVSREQTLFSTIQEDVQSCRIHGVLSGLVRAAAQPLFHTVE